MSYTELVIMETNIYEPCPVCGEMTCETWTRQGTNLTEEEQGEFEEEETSGIYCQGCGCVGWGR